MARVDGTEDGVEARSIVTSMSAWFRPPARRRRRRLNLRKGVVAMIGTFLTLGAAAQALRVEVIWDWWPVKLYVGEDDARLRIDADVYR